MPITPAGWCPETPNRSSDNPLTNKSPADPTGERQQQVIAVRLQGSSVAQRIDWTLMGATLLGVFTRHRWAWPSALSIRWWVALVRCIMGAAVDSDEGSVLSAAFVRAVLVSETSSRDGLLRTDRAES
jgi:hypothetical protein